jgi:putative nucleotidyltransferase with HDIG domain
MVFKTQVFLFTRKFEMNYSISQLIQEASKLPPFPKAAQKALELIRNPDSNAADLAGTLGTDQILSARVLRQANSAYYGMENKIVTVQQAIVLLGMNIIRDLIMTSAASHYLDRPVAGYELQRGELWHHALGTAVGARLISKRHHLGIDEEAYFAGLLCDIGKLIFGNLLKDIDANKLECECQSFLDVERANFGIDHAKLGAEIARQWQLPENLVSAIAYHHEPQSAQGHQLLVATIHIADVSMMILGIGIGIDGLRYPMEEDALKRIGMTWEDLFHLADDVAEELTRAKEKAGLG